MCRDSFVVSDFTIRNNVMNMNYRMTIDLAGIPLDLVLRYALAGDYFRSFATDREGLAELSISDTDWDRLVSNGFKRCAEVEASYMSAYCSSELLKYNRCIVHAVAFRDKENAWLIAAPSGVGKTTQFMTLQDLYPGTYSMICGDRPVLQLMDDGKVMVHPAPWNGKEHMGGADPAPLAGLILLSRGEQNQIRQCSAKQSVIPVFKTIIQTALTEKDVKLAAGFVSELLKRVRVWEFINEDIPDSTRLLHDTVLMEV